MSQSYNITKQKFHKGDSWSWTEDLLLYPPDQFYITAYIKQSTNKPIEIKSENLNGSHSFLIGASKTSTANEGVNNFAYRAVLRSDEENKKIIHTGSITIFPDFSDAKADPRPFWQKVFENYQSAYLALSSREVDSISVLGDEFTYQDRAKLLGLMKNAETEMNIQLGRYTGPKIFKAVIR